MLSSDIISREEVLKHFSEVDWDAELKIEWYSISYVDLIFGTDIRRM